MILVIPTVGRVGKITTLRYLPDRWKRKTWLIAQNGETHEHRFVSCDLRTLPEVRQWVMKTAQWSVKSLGGHVGIFPGKHRFVFFLDDDLRFQIRAGDSQDRYRLRAATPAEVGEGIDLIQAWLESGKFALAGFGPVFFNNAIPGEFRDNTRTCGNFALDRRVFLREKLKFDEPGVVLNDEQHVNLSLLERGYANRVSYKYVVAPGPENAPGGCSRYRTAELNRTSAEALARLHPGNVRLYENKRRRAEGLGEKGTQLDVRIAWRRAYMSRLPDR